MIQQLLVMNSNDFQRNALGSIRLAQTHSHYVSVTTDVIITLAIVITLNDLHSSNISIMYSVSFSYTYAHSKLVKINAHCSIDEVVYSKADMIC